MSIAAVAVDTYRHFRFTWWGVCYQCGQRFTGVATQRRDPDNPFSDLVQMPVCTCKDAKYMPVRNFAE